MVCRSATDAICRSVTCSKYRCCRSSLILRGFSYFEHITKGRGKWREAAVWGGEISPVGTSRLRCARRSRRLSSGVRPHGQPWESWSHTAAGCLGCTGLPRSGAQHSLPPSRHDSTRRPNLCSYMSLPRHGPWQSHIGPVRLYDCSCRDSIGLPSCPDASEQRRASKLGTILSATLL